ncbi:hypothetical protein BS78_02G270500 [Paspalum vaginatum]|nr:hypothetical protein BS78_02G270500 [Paspalum vaginatum]
MRSDARLHSTPASAPAPRTGRARLADARGRGRPSWRARAAGAGRGRGPRPRHGSGLPLSAAPLPTFRAATASPIPTEPRREKTSAFFSLPGIRILRPPPVLCNWELRSRRSCPPFVF